MHEHLTVPMQAGDRHLRPPKRRAQERPLHGEPLWVEKPEVKEVLDADTGRHLGVADVMGTDYVRLVQLRMEVRARIHKGDPLYRCSLCGVAVYICRAKESFKFFFRHQHEDGGCPARTRGALSQDEIDARKYNGAKESKLHRRMKDWVCQCLEVDGRFQDIAQEPVWTGPLTGERRRPDVRALYNGLPIAFEIQLSTTHLDVIAARRDFYQREGGLLVWLFAEFDTEHRRMTDDDVFYNNNLNAFVVTTTTVEASLNAREFKLECIWAQPTRSGDPSGLHRQLVGFHELTLDARAQQAFFFDYAAAKRALSADIDAAKQQLRDDFEAWMGARGYYGPNSARDWQHFRRRFLRFGVPLPQDHRQIDRELLTDLYSAKNNRPWGQGQKRLVEVAHRIANTEKDHLVWFMHAVDHYGRKESLKNEGKPGWWEQRLQELRLEYLKDRTLFEPRRDAEAMVEVLFPELLPLPQTATRTG